MSLPYLPGWGDAIKANLPQLGQNISTMIAPERDRLRAMLNIIAADPTKADAYAMLNQANPQLMGQIAGKNANLGSDATVTTPTAQQNAIGAERVKQAGSATTIAGNAAEASQFDPQRASVALELDRTNLDANKAKNTLLQNEVNNVVAGQGLAPFNVGSFLSGKYTPEEEAKYFAAVGPAIEAKLRARMQDNNNAIQREGFFFRNAGQGSNYDDVMRAANVRNTQIKDIEAKIADKKTKKSALPGLYNELNKLQKERWAIFGTLGSPESLVMQWVEVPGKLYGTNWEQQLVNPAAPGVDKDGNPLPAWDYSGLARTAGLNIPSQGSTSGGGYSTTQGGTSTQAPANTPAAPTVETGEMVDMGNGNTMLLSALPGFKANFPEAFAKLPKETQAKVK